MTTTDPADRARRAHVAVVLGTTLAWVCSAAVVAAEMRGEREETPSEAAQSAVVADASLADAGLRPAPSPRRRVVVVRRSRAS